MKVRTIVTIAALALMVYSMSGCVTTEIVNPDGTIIRQTQPAVGAVETAAAISGLVATKVLNEK